MHDDADFAPVLRDPGLPLCVREGARESGECMGPLFQAIGEGVCSLAHCSPLVDVW